MEPLSHEKRVTIDATMYRVADAPWLIRRLKGARETTGLELRKLGLRVGMLQGKGLIVAVAGGKRKADGPAGAEASAGRSDESEKAEKKPPTIGLSKNLSADEAIGRLREKSMNEEYARAFIAGDQRRSVARAFEVHYLEKDNES